jgi:hypothetical protein
MTNKANEIRLLVSRQRPHVILAPHQKVSLLPKFHYFAKKGDNPTQSTPKQKARSPCSTATRHASRQCDLPVPCFQIAAPSLTLCMEL